MIVYDGLKTDFLTSCEKDSIAMEIEENILSKMGKHTPKAEFRSWENSLNYMYKVLNDDAIPADAGIAIEFNIIKCDTNFFDNFCNWFKLNALCNFDI